MHKTTNLAHWGSQCTSAPDQNTPLHEKEAAANTNLEALVTMIIHDFGIPAHITGYFYLREALIYAIKNMAIVTGITKTLYPAIAKMYGTTPSRVERSIRHAIEISWDRCDQAVQQKFFHYSSANTKYRPTNSEFIATVSDYIKLKLKYEAVSPAVVSHTALAGSEFVAIQHLNFLAGSAPIIAAGVGHTR